MLLYGSENQTKAFECLMVMVLVRRFREVFVALVFDCVHSVIIKFHKVLETLAVTRFTGKRRFWVAGSSESGRHSGASLGRFSRCSFA